MLKVQVEVRGTALLNERVAGVDGGRAYHVNPTTRRLHAAAGTTVNPEPGVTEEDAAEYAKFPKTFVVIGDVKPAVRPAQPSRRPPPPPVPARPVEDVAKLPEIPEDVDKLTRAQWLDMATQLQVAFPNGTKDLTKRQIREAILAALPST